MQSVLAFILAGGRVDELQTLTKYRPKSAVPFGGSYRIIDFPLSNLMHSRIGTVGLLSQYRSSPLINHILDGRSWDLWGGLPANLAAIQALQQYMAEAIGILHGEMVVESKGLHLYGYAEDLAKMRCLKE